MRWIVELGSRGDLKLPGAVGRPQINTSGGAREYTVKSRHYHNTYFLRWRRCGHQMSE